MKQLETPHTFTLRTPLVIGEHEHAEITLREPTAGEIEQLARDQEKHGAVSAMVMLIGRQAKIAPVDVRNLGARDFNRMQEYIGAFFVQADQPSES